MTPPQSHQPTEPEPGETPLELQELAADYEIEGELGRGGTAVVYRARDRMIDRVVAIKVIRAPYVGDDELVARLEREARLVARLDHPNVVALLGIRRLRHGSLALIMRYVQGHTLRTELQRRGALPLARAIAVANDVGNALAAAHAHGIVHRDVKPENIHIELGVQRALLADFGAATPLRGDLRLTVAGMAIGTPGYMAPELIDGGQPTPAADVYGLGLVVWEMLAGRAPWEGDSLFAVLSFRKQGQLVELESLRDDIPPAVSAAIAGALHTDPAQRWPDMHRFLEELNRPAPRRWLGGPHGSRRASLFGAPAPPHDPQVSLRGGLGKPASEQPTMRLNRADRGTDPSSFAPPGITPSASPPPAMRAPAAEPHPSLAVHAVDDSDGDDDLDVEEFQPEARGRWRRPLAIVAALLVVGTALGVGRFLTLGDPTVATVAEAGGDVPATFAVRPPPATEAAADGPGIVAVDSSFIDPDSSPLAGGTPPLTEPGAGASTTASGGSPAGMAATPRSVTPTPAAARRGATAPPPSGARPPAVDRGAVATAPPRQPVAAPPAAAAVRNPPAAEPTSPPRTASPSTDPIMASGRSAAVSLGLGGLHSCAILEDGRLRCWGADDKGQLGPAGDTRFREIAAGVTHSCGRTTEGRTVCWGANDRGQLGDGTRTTHRDARPVPGSDDQVALALGAAHSCALTRNGEIECWGANDAGQLGAGDNRDRATPVTVAGQLRFSAVAAGWRHDCAITTDGLALCWGDNSSGQLGDGTTENRNVPTPINSSLRFRTVTAGRAHSCGLTTTGQLYCWGSNDAGQLGIGSRADASTPRQVDISGPFRSLVAGSMHNCALSAEGIASCWGQNRYGQLGDGTTIDRDRPVRVAGPTRFAELEASGAHSCGRTGDGDVLCWGYNLYGQLGDGTRQNRLRPAAAALPP